MSFEQIISGKIPISNQSPLKRVKTLVTQNKSYDQWGYPYTINIHRSAHLAAPGVFTNGRLMRGLSTPFSSNLTNMDVHTFSGASGDSALLKTDLSDKLFPVFSNWTSYGTNVFGGFTLPCYSGKAKSGYSAVFQTNSSTIGIIAGGNYSTGFEVWADSGSGPKLLNPWFPIVGTNECIELSTGARSIVYFNFPSTDPKANSNKTIFVKLVGNAFLSAICLNSGSLFNVAPIKNSSPVVAYQGDSIGLAVQLAISRLGIPCSVGEESGGSGYSKFSGLITGAGTSGTGTVGGYFRIVGISQTGTVPSTTVTATAVWGPATYSSSWTNNGTQIFGAGAKVIFTGTGTALDGQQVTVTSVGGSASAGWQCSFSFASTVSEYSGTNSSPVGYVDTCDPSVPGRPSLYGYLTQPPTAVAVPSTLNISRRSDDISIVPDMVFIGLGRNDGVQSAADTYNTTTSTWNPNFENDVYAVLSYYRANLPNAVLVCIGTWPCSAQVGPDGTSDSQQISQIDSLYTKIQSVAGPWIFVSTKDNTFKVMPSPITGGSLRSMTTNWASACWIRGTAILSQADSAGVNTIGSSNNPTYSNSIATQGDGTHPTDPPDIGKTFRTGSNVTWNNTPLNLVLFNGYGGITTTNITQSAGSVTVTVGGASNPFSVGSKIVFGATTTSLDGNMYSVSSIGGSGGAWTATFTGSYTGTLNGGTNPQVGILTATVATTPINTTTKFSIIPPNNPNWGTGTDAEWIATIGSRNSAAGTINITSLTDYQGTSIASGTVIPAGSMIYQRSVSVNFDGTSGGYSDVLCGKDYFGCRVAECVVAAIPYL